MTQSRAEVFSLLSHHERIKTLQKMAPGVDPRVTLNSLKYNWEWNGRPEQLEPGTPGAALQRIDWTYWLILAGRGFGKTKTGAEFIRRNVCGDTPLTGGNYGNVAIIAETAADARHVMVEALLQAHPPDYRPEYSPANRQIKWPNGAVGYHFNATEPDQLRGPQFDIGWLDELAKWAKISTDKQEENPFRMFQMALRLGAKPRACITTTPRPLPLIKEIRDNPRTVWGKYSTKDNLSNLAPTFIEEIYDRYEGTRLGRQELEAEILDDAPGALWTRGMLDRNRMPDLDSLPEMKRIVVSIDPAVSVSDDGASETGIVVCGLGIDGRGYVLGDLSGHFSPDEWARRAVSGYDLHEADAIVCERNQGGDLVSKTIRSVRPSLKIIEVVATRGKVVRAEPIAALYEQDRVSHGGLFNELEDQMLMFTLEGPIGGAKADRVDAMVWGMSELFNRIVKSRGRKQRNVVLEGIKRFNPLQW